MMRVAVLGLGIMGSRIARRLLDAGFGVTVWNRTPQRAKALRERGAEWADSPAAAAGKTGVAITMLGDPESVRAVALGPNGVIAALPTGGLYVDMTTVDPETPRALAIACRERGVEFLEAPVTGSKLAAAAGELVLMVGGAPHALGRALPVLQPLAKKIVHMGATGAGAQMKLVNNLVIAGAMQALFEGMVLARKAALPLDRVAEVLNSGGLAAPLVRLKTDAVLRRDFEPHFSVKHMAKDLALALDEAAGCNMPLPVTAIVNGMYQAARAHSLDEQDFAALVTVVEQLAGLPPEPG